MYRKNWLFANTNKTMRSVNAEAKYITECTSFRFRDDLKYDEVVQDMYELYNDIQKYFPEVNKLGSWVDVYKDDEGNNCINVYWRRNMYDFDKEDLRMQKEVLDKAARWQLEDLIKKYPDLAKELLEQM